ncbi:MAG: siderophore-interacting protein [bacterium]|nr:siderophore-interacting protein [bacterium]
MSGAVAYRLFDVQVVRRTPLSPSLCRLTFTGDAVADMGRRAPDQRIKIFFPTPDGRPPALPPDWLRVYPTLPPAARPPRRTYTIRALRPAAAEVDVDFVLHGDTGPASAWATSAAPGDRVQMVAPDGRFDGDPGGYEWRPPPRLERVLLMADETALPALAGILEELAAMLAPPRTEAFVEVPSADDRIALPIWRGLSLAWTARGHAEPGAALVTAAARAELPCTAAPASPLPDENLDVELLWDRAAPADGGFYAWIAAEAGAVKTIRRILVAERGVERSAAVLMGYWRRGRALE